MDRDVEESPECRIYSKVAESPECRVNAKCTAALLPTGAQSDKKYIGILENHNADDFQNTKTEKNDTESLKVRLIHKDIFIDKLMSYQDMSNTNDNSNYDLETYEGQESTLNKDDIIALGNIDEDDVDEYSDSNGSEDETEETGSGSEEDSVSQQNLFYFQNMDQLMSNYFANEDVNIVNAIQGLEKTVKEFCTVMKESMEQNAKCTLRVAKILEAAASAYKK